ncbi:MAG: hypothetical protein IPP13_21750 [Kouleothrix sp.]|jgi:hypothetical protein|nr:hypothetical protein [Kouleothrix sp.]
MASFSTYNRVWEHCRQRGLKKLIMLAFAKYADPMGVCWPSVEALAELTGERNISYLRSVIAELVAAGELIKNPGKGRGNATVYGVMVGLDAQMADQLREVVHQTIVQHGVRIHRTQKSPPELTISGEQTEKSPSELTVSEKSPSELTVSEKSPSELTVSEKSPSELTVSEKSPLELTISGEQTEKSPLELTVSEKSPPEWTVSGDAPPEKSPLQKSPLQKSPLEKSPLQPQKRVHYSFGDEAPNPASQSPKTPQNQQDNYHGTHGGGDVGVAAETIRASPKRPPPGSGIPRHVVYLSQHGMGAAHLFADCDPDAAIDDFNARMADNWTISAIVHAWKQIPPRPGAIYEQLQPDPEHKTERSARAPRPSSRSPRPGELDYYKRKT